MFELFNQYWWVVCSLIASGVGFSISVVAINGTTFWEWLGVVIQSFILAMVMEKKADDVNGCFGLIVKVVLGLLVAGISGFVAAFGIHALLYGSGLGNFSVPLWLRVIIAVCIGLFLAFAG